MELSRLACSLMQLVALVFYSSLYLYLAISTEAVAIPRGARLLLAAASSSASAGAAGVNPSSLHDLLSPLTRQEEARYAKQLMMMKRTGGPNGLSDSVLNQFCKSARLLCGAALQESRWGHTVIQNEISVMASTHAEGNDHALEAETEDNQEQQLASLLFAALFHQCLIKCSSEIHSQPSTSSLEDHVSMSSTRMDETNAEAGAIQHDQFPLAAHHHLSVDPANSTVGTPGHHPMLYFREKDLVLGKWVVLPAFLFHDDAATTNNVISGLRKEHIITNGSTTTLTAKLPARPAFLPASLALLLPPLQPQHLNEIARLFHIPLTSRMARQISHVLDACSNSQVQYLDTVEDSIITNFCATSYEAMRNFASLMIGAPSDRIQPLTNSHVELGKACPSHVLTIEGLKEVAARGSHTVDCHNAPFPFKVMGCYRIKDSKSFSVRLTAGDHVGGRFKMDLLVACHMNTASFNPHHEAFSQLNSSPGHTEVCHWLSNNDIMWVPL